MRYASHGPSPKAEVYHCGGWHSHASTLSVLPVCGQSQMLLDDGPGGVVLQVE
jgi:hypothetical protein